MTNTATTPTQTTPSGPTAEAPAAPDPAALASASGSAPASAPALAPGLHLKKLTLNGFKSFADKTTFSFDNPITGVVGPNGCGKSNLVDALKWVLGERSSKSLRGKEMIDVIFAGSAVRKPAGMAAVAMTFENPVLSDAPSAVVEDHSEDNTDPDTPPSADVETPADDHAPEHSAEHVADEPAESILSDRKRISRPLPYDADEVTVERQLYRDGTSKYLINGRRARLKDIRDLFLDTGIGADAYSIIEQGKVDAMLLASPQERRTIFEEAAGIAKFKQRRIESQRKLDRAESNLMRTREQLDSTERRLRIVRGQAAKARRFKELDDECSALRLAVAFDQYDEVSQRLAGLTSQLQSLETERDRTQRELAECEESLQTAELRHAEAATELRTIQDAIREAEHGRDAASQKQQMAGRAVEESKRQLDIDLNRLEEATARLDTLDADITDQRESIAAIAERAADAERALDAASQQRSAAAESIAASRAEHDKSASALRTTERERDGLRADVRTLTDRLADLDSERSKHTARAEAIDAERSESLAKRQAAHDAIAERTSGVDRLEKSISELSARADDLAGAKRERSEHVDQLSERRAGLDARRATLEEMVRTRAGLAEAARWVMDRRETGEGFGGVVAPLVELLETDTAHAAAVEAALGADLQAVVTRSVTTGPTADEIAGLPGRVRFLPLDGLGQAPTPADPESFANLPGSRLVAVRSLVRARHDSAETPDAFGGLLDRLLDRTYLVEDVENALLLLAGPLAGTPGVRVVTRRGEVVDRTGAIDAGPAGSQQGEGLIRHAAELTEIETELGTVTAELDRERGELGRLNDAWAGVNEQRETLAAELAEDRRSLVGEQSRAERLEADIARSERDASGVQAELERCIARRDELHATRETKAEQADTLDARAESLRSETESHAERLASLATDAESAAERMSTAREQASRANAELEAARRALSSLTRTRDETADAMGEHERHAQQARERHARHEALIAEAAGEIERCEALVAEQQANLGTQTELAETTERERHAAAARVTESRERARLVERDWHGVEASRRELEVKRETLEERASEDMRIDLGAEYLEYRAVMAPGDVERVDIADSQARINVLRGEIKKLGNVNLDSIAEEGQLGEADERLRAQIADLDEARERLTDLIGRLNEASRERFGEVFELIRENFGGQGGMFRRLFGGGKAEVRLMGLVKEVEDADGTVRKVVTDQTDLLESGIEVIAKPPGKEPRSISQLSGGEKTLTAVALLMAIFRSKPSCFCVLDEVDAALDEANVGRFCQTVRAFTDMSAFIIITHNKRTMQLADHLYGVTQQERGVSKRVSVRFDRVKSDGSFDASAAKPEQDDATEPDSAGTPAVKAGGKPSGALRKALASMRTESQEPAEVPVEAEG